MWVRRLRRPGSTTQKESRDVRPALRVDGARGHAAAADSRSAAARHPAVVAGRHRGRSRPRPRRPTPDGRCAGRASRLSGPELGREGRSTSTSLDGRYEITGLPAGRYTIRVTRSGYLPLQYGQRRPLEPGKPLQLTDKQVIDHVDFSMPRSSVISGQITDELADPVADVQVFAMRSTYFQGRRRMIAVGPPARTDDAGEYRLTGLSPGSYFVMAALRETWTVTENGVERTMGYAPTYAPGTASLTDARRVTVAVGQSAGNNNFALMPGVAASVSGTAADSLGRPLVSRNIMVMQEFGGPAFGMMMLGGNATTAADGTFTDQERVPGRRTSSSPRRRGTRRPPAARCWKSRRSSSRSTAPTSRISR